jgi:hypothetical protein
MPRYRGAAARTRDEGSLMELDQRGCVVQPKPWANRQLAYSTSPSVAGDRCARSLSVTDIIV